MDIRSYYDEHWTKAKEGEVDYSRLEYVLDFLSPGERVLDSGCGPGFLAELLMQRGMVVTGTDV
jgi:2-polyprenyl-3-methyl-5-hydroxy-6-metoxy-1,4-benzoquinol methylase